jgi:hypothetical protein
MIGQNRDLLKRRKCLYNKPDGIFDMDSGPDLGPGAMPLPLGRRVEYDSKAFPQGLQVPSVPHTAALS